MTARGGARQQEGIGIEVVPDGIRVVRAAADGAVRATAEVGSRDDRAAALVRACAAVGGIGGGIAAVRLACFPATAQLWAVEVTAAPSGRLAALLRDWRVAGVVAVAVAPAADRRWAVATRWDGDGRAELASVARRAGLPPVVVEPSPLALARVIGAGVLAVRRDDAVSWRAVVVDGLPLGATALAIDAGTEPRVTARPATAADLVALGLSDGVGAAPRSPWTSPAELSVLAVPGRDAVAYGAAIGAAGLASRAPAHVLDRRRSAPWVVEHVAEDGAPTASVEPPPRRRWRPGRPP